MSDTCESIYTKMQIVICFFVFIWLYTDINAGIAHLMLFFCHWYSYPCLWAKCESVCLVHSPIVKYELMIIFFQFFMFVIWHKHSDRYLNTGKFATWFRSATSSHHSHPKLWWLQLGVCSWMAHWLTIQTFFMLSLLFYMLSSKGTTLFFGAFLKAAMQVIQTVHTVQLSSERWLWYEFIVF